VTLTLQRRRSSRVTCVLHLAVVFALGGCAARRVALPSDAGAPFPDYARVFDGATAACRGARTLTAELALSGHAGGERLRGHVVAGFSRPSSMRLEGVAPFGAPAFILVADGSSATLLLPRAHHVVRGASPGPIHDALTCVALAPDDLEAILTGCVEPLPMAAGGRLHGDGWASIDLAGGATLYLRRVGSGWQIRAARRDRWRVDYPAWQGAFPSTVRLQSADAQDVDLTAELSQVEANVGLDEAAFTVDVPADATPLSIEALRGAGPLQGR
jgi:outer membrane lipoprotein-sorting protein